MMFCVMSILNISHPSPRDVSLRTCMPGIVVEKAAQYRAEEEILASNTCRNIGTKQRPNCSPNDQCVRVLFWGPIPIYQPFQVCSAGKVRPSHVDTLQLISLLTKHKWRPALSPNKPVQEILRKEKIQPGCWWWWEGLSQHIFFPFLPIITPAQNEKNKSSHEVLEYLLLRQRLKTCTSHSFKKLSAVGCTGYSSTKPASAGKEFKSSGQKKKRCSTAQDRAGSLSQTVCVPACQRQPVSQLHALCSPGTWDTALIRVTLWGPQPCHCSCPVHPQKLPWDPPLSPAAPDKETAPHVLCSHSLAQPGPPCHLSLAEQMNRCHLWEKTSRAGRHSSPGKMAQPCSWTDSQGGRAAREPQHQFPLNSQENTVFHVLQKPHLINLLCTPALWWEFYSIC